MYNLAKVLLFAETPAHGGTKSKQWVIVLLACNADGSDKLPPLATANTQVHIALRMLKTSQQNMMPIHIPGKTPRYLNTTLTTREEHKVKVKLTHAGTAFRFWELSMQSSAIIEKRLFEILLPL